jgi:uncharacterized protein YjeT (DUF2065 family)
MIDRIGALSEYARIALAVIRLVNGLMALLTPAGLLRRLGVNPKSNSVALYALRMFGIRTVLIGVGLLLPAGDVRSWSLRTAPVVHGSDTAAAVMLALRGTMPRRSRVTVVLISLTNFVLSLVAQRRRA